jgi:hypothetical protein
MLLVDVIIMLMWSSRFEFYYGAGEELPSYVLVVLSIFFLLLFIIICLSFMKMSHLFFMNGWFLEIHMVSQ